MALNLLPLHPGDWVLVKNPKFGWESKLDPWWKTTPYQVEKQLFPPLPVYYVISKGPEDNRKCLYQNLLRPCVLGRDYPVRASADLWYSNPTVLPPVQELPAEWYLPPLQAIPMNPTSLEDETAADSLADP